MDLRAGSRVWGILAVVGMNALIGCAADPPSIGVQAAALVATPITANPTLKLPPTTTAAIQAAFSEPSTLQSALSLEQRAQTAQDKLQASARTLTALRRDRVVASVAGTPLPDIAAAQSALQKNLKDLAAIETQLDTTYRDGYGLLAKNAKGQAGALTRLALLQFRTSYRRSGPGANDLRVGPLPRAPECTSGPIDGPLLWQFFDPASRAPDNSQTVRVIYVDSHAWNDNEAAGRGSANVDTLLHEAIHAMLDFMGLTDSTTEEREHRVISNLSTNRDCAADDPNCSTGCSAQDEQLAALAECTKAPAQPRDPGYVDPLPDDATAPAWSSCFSELGDSVADGQRACQTVDCAIDRVCDAARGGVCVSDSDVAVPGGFQRACAAVDCADGLPQFDAGRCRCGASYQSVEPRPEIPL